MNININFELNKRDYDQYEGILQEFLNYMSDLGYTEIDVFESEEEE